MRGMILSIAIFLVTLRPFEASGLCHNSGYRVGAAQDDITGPIAELGLLGYADLGQVGEGLHMRLRSHTLVKGCRLL